MPRTNFRDYQRGNISLREVTRCIFCGASPPKLTNEHIFSVWTHKFMPPRTPGRVESYRGTEYLDRTESFIVKLPGQVRDWQVRCVCGGHRGTCNNGWMRKIEEAARPFMVPLIQGKSCRIDSTAQQWIAAWAAMKAMVSDYDHGGPVTTNHMHRRWIKDHMTPPLRGWGVWIGHFERNKWIPHWISRPFCLVRNKEAIKSPSREATYFNGEAITQVIGKLLIHVIHSPMPDFVTRWRFPLPQSKPLFRIWPASSVGIKWPGGALHDADAEKIANAVIEFMMADAPR